ncbi:hypothetical protein ACFQX7_00560 [Luedemannella flava]
MVVARRVPCGIDRDVLMRCYGYRFTSAGTIKAADPSDAPADLAAARDAGWPVRHIDRWSAREVVERAVEAADRLHEDAVLAAFVAGLGSARADARRSFRTVGRVSSAPRPGKRVGCPTAVSIRQRMSM